MKNQVRLTALAVVGLLVLGAVSWRALSGDSATTAREPLASPTLVDPSSAAQTPLGTADPVELRKPAANSGTLYGGERLWGYRC